MFPPAESYREKWTAWVKEFAKQGLTFDRTPGGGDLRAGREGDGVRLPHRFRRAAVLKVSAHERG